MQKAQGLAAKVADRRSFIAGVSALSGLTLVGCKPSEQAPSAPSAGAQPDQAVKTASGTVMTVYRDPSCGCCEVWAQQARGQNFAVTLIDRPDMPAIKRQHGVPDELSSCHTAIVAGYAIEGHVPFADVRRLLVEKPTGIRGLAVPGMPRGSPGMEMPDGSKDPFQVMAFDAEGRASVFSKQQV